MSPTSPDLATVEGLTAAVEQFRWELPSTGWSPGALMGLVMGHQHASEYLLRALGNLSAGDLTQVAHAIETWCEATDGHATDRSLNDALRKFASVFEAQDMPGDQWVRFVENLRRLGFALKPGQDDSRRRRMVSEAVGLAADPDTEEVTEVLRVLAQTSDRQGGALYRQWDMGAPAVQGEDPGHREADPDVPFDDLTALNVLCASILGLSAWNAVGALTHLVGEGPVLAALNDLSPPA